MAEIELKGVTKRWGAFVGVKDLDLTIADREFLVLLGPSGCGKTTLLRIIAGLETADAGSVLFGGEDALRRHPRDRRVGFVFQHYALFRHMTVFDNVAFGLQVRPRAQRPPKAAIAERPTLSAEQQVMFSGFKQVLDGSRSPKEQATALQEAWEKAKKKGDIPTQE